MTWVNVVICIPVKPRKDLVLYFSSRCLRFSWFSRLITHQRFHIFALKPLQNTNRSHSLPVKHDHRRAAPMTGSARHCFWRHLPTLACTRYSDAAITRIRAVFSGFVNGTVDKLNHIDTSVTDGQTNCRRTRRVATERSYSASQNRVLDGDRHWRQLTNTTERSMRGGDATLCQITLTNCCYY